MKQHMNKTYHTLCVFDIEANCSDKATSCCICLAAVKLQEMMWIYFHVLFRRTWKL